jgi:PHS family inorganic phosphate transporter-like MFS transporter
LPCVSHLSSNHGNRADHLDYRLTIPETPRYTFDVARDVEKAGNDVEAYMSGKAEGNPDELARVQALREANAKMTVQKASWGDFFRHYSKPKNGMLLAG